MRHLLTSIKVRGNRASGPLAYRTIRGTVELPDSGGGVCAWRSRALGTAPTPCRIQFGDTADRKSALRFSPCRPLNTSSGDAGDFPKMKTKCPCHYLTNLALSTALFTALPAFAEAPKLPGIGAAMQEMIAKNEIAGAVTVVVTKDKLLHLESTGLADVAAKRPMTPGTLFWIASMTKPITGAAMLMLQDEGKLNVA